MIVREGGKELENSGASLNFIVVSAWRLNPARVIEGR